MTNVCPRFWFSHISADDDAKWRSPELHRYGETFPEHSHYGLSVQVTVNGIAHDWEIGFRV